VVTQTSAARRERAKREYDAFLATCPSRQLLEMIGNKWVGLVLGSLESGPQRHSAIGRQIAGISQKMLTQTLRELERDGLVTRTVTLAVPVRVDYQLTTLGQDLQAVVRPLKIWAEHNMDRILEHRARAT
jgi:DNA-binding HxlR family transcriptional regulator